MSAKIWTRTLSIIALVLVGSSVLMEIWNAITNVGQFDTTELTVLLLAIVLVIMVFSKKK